MSHLLVEWSGMQVKFDGGGGDVWWYREADELAASYIPFKNITLHSNFVWNSQGQARYVETGENQTDLLFGEIYRSSIRAKFVSLQCSVGEFF